MKHLSAQISSVHQHETKTQKSIPRDAYLLQGWEKGLIQIIILQCCKSMLLLLNGIVGYCHAAQSGI